jgi:hypothetical protein
MMRSTCRVDHGMDTLPPQAALYPSPSLPLDLGRLPIPLGRTVVE